MKSLLAYVVFDKIDENISYLYVPNSVILTFSGSQVINFDEKEENLAKMKTFVKDKYDFKVNVNLQDINFILDTGRRYKKLKARFEKVGSKIIEDVLNSELRKNNGLESLT